MKKWQILKKACAGLALLLSHIMCAETAYRWCELEWGGRYAGYSAPPQTALFLLIPYGAGILLLAVAAAVFAGRESRGSRPEGSP